MPFLGVRASGCSDRVGSVARGPEARLAPAVGLWGGTEQWGCLEACGCLRADAPEGGAGGLDWGWEPCGGGRPGTREEGRGGLGLGVGDGGWVLQAKPRARGVCEAGRRAVLGAGRSVCAVPGVSSGLCCPRSPPRPTAPYGSEEGPGPWCRGLGGKAALAVSSLTPSASSPAAPSSRLPSAGLASGRQVSKAQGRAPAPPELAPLGQRVCGSDLGVHRPLLRSGLPHV